MVSGTGAHNMGGLSNASSGATCSYENGHGHGVHGNHSLDGLGDRRRNAAHCSARIPETLVDAFPPQEMHEFQTPVAWHQYRYLHLTSQLRNTLPMGECLPGTCPARYLCIKYLISSPKFFLTLGSPPSRLHWTANLLRKTPCVSPNMRIQQHKMSLPPLPTTTLAIVINWVQGMGQIHRHGKKVLQIVW